MHLMGLFRLRYAFPFEGNRNIVVTYLAFCLAILRYAFPFEGNRNFWSSLVSISRIDACDTLSRLKGIETCVSNSGNPGMIYFLRYAFPFEGN